MVENKRKISLRELAQLLECPVCLQSSDIVQYVQCKNGHFGCYDCFSRLRKCPLCRINLRLKKDTMAKTIAYETCAVIQNELRHVENFEGQVDLKYFLKIFKCSSCLFNPTRVPISQCINGHILCDDCYNESNPVCFICQSYFYSPHFRSLIAESILSYLAKPCRFAKHGCKVNISELRDHDKENCIFREVYCVFIGCFKQIPIFKLTDHLKEDHHTLATTFQSNQREMQNTDKGKLHLPENISDLQTFSDWKKFLYLKLDNINDFVAVSFACSIEKDFIFCVYYLGLPCERHLYLFELKLWINDNSKEINVTGPITSLNKTFCEMYNSETAFKIPFYEIITFWGKNCHRELLWAVSVIRKPYPNFNDEIIVNKIPLEKNKSSLWSKLCNYLN